MDWAKSDQDVGFNVNPPASDLDQEMEKQSRSFFLLLALFMALLTIFILWKNGARAKQFLVVKDKGVVLSANPIVGAEIAGSVQQSGTFVVSKIVNVGDKFTLEAKAKPKKHKAHGHHGHNAGHHDDEESKAEPKVVDIASTWFKIHTELRGEMKSDLGQIHYGHGWIAAGPSVEVKAAGIKGAFARAQTKISVVLALGLLFLVIGLFAAKAMVPFMKKWFQYVVEPLAFVNTRVLLSVVFYGVIAPMALYRRLALDIDGLETKMEKDKASYWNERKELDKSHFKRRF